MVIIQSFWILRSQLQSLKKQKKNIVGHLQSTSSKFALSLSALRRRIVSKINFFLGSIWKYPSKVNTNLKRANHLTNSWGAAEFSNICSKTRRCSGYTRLSFLAEDVHHKMATIEQISVTAGKLLPSSNSHLNLAFHSLAKAVFSHVALLLSTKLFWPVAVNVCFSLIAVTAIPTRSASNRKRPHRKLCLRREIDMMPIFSLTKPTQDLRQNREALMVCKIVSRRRWLEGERDWAGWIWWPCGFLESDRGVPKRQ